MWFVLASRLDVLTEFVLVSRLDVLTGFVLVSWLDLYLSQIDVLARFVWLCLDRTVHLPWLECTVASTGMYGCLDWNVRVSQLDVLTGMYGCLNWDVRVSWQECTGVLTKMHSGPDQIAQLNQQTSWEQYIF
jgi:hypothetical protein